MCITYQDLVLQATNSVAQMGLVTGIFGLGQLLANLVSGLVVDRVNRRLLMIYCDLGRCLVYLAIPLGWLIIGPQLWLIYFGAVFGAVLGAFFQVSYITAVANLVEKDKLTEANGRLQVSMGVVFVLGPMLAGLISAQFGSTAAIGIDAVSFSVSALSLVLVRLKPTSAESNLNRKSSLRQEWLEGVSFLFHSRILFTVMIILAFSSFISTATLDLFIFHLKHDLGQDDNAVGLVLGIASVGAIISGLTVSVIRRKFGFGVCLLGGLALCALAEFGIAYSGLLLIIAPLAMLFLLGDTTKGIVSMSLRQQITPDYLLGRVTSIFWVGIAVPGPSGAAICTALADQLGASNVLAILGVVSLGLAGVGLFTPARLRNPDKS